MKLEKFLEHVQELTKNIPDRENLEVIFSVDDEGNEYRKVNLQPSLCEVEEDPQHSWIKVIGFEDDPYLDQKDINAICIT